MPAEMFMKLQERANEETISLSALIRRILKRILTNKKGEIIMAILQAQAENSSGFDIDELPPSGNYVATCLDIADEFGVTRRKYQSEETEEIDVTRFLFGFKGKDGTYIRYKHGR